MPRLISILFFLFPFICFSQVNIINRSLTDSSLNIAYLGIDNVIELTGYKDSGKLNFSATNGSIRNLGQNRYLLNPDKPGECIVSFQKKDQKIISKIFKVDSLPKPAARFNKSYDSTSQYPGINAIYMKFNDFLSSPSLLVYYPNSFYNHDCKVTKFHITFDSLNPNLITEFIINDNKLSEKHIEAFKKYKNGCYVAVDMIEISCAGSSSKKIDPPIFQIK
jgi:hypothetical protein